MAKHLFSNHASALLAASIDDNDLTIQVASAYGQFFPSPGAGQEFIVTLRNAAGDYEYCRITSRSTDLLTVAPGGRGYDGSTAQSWVNGQTRVEFRLTKKIMEEFLQRSGDVMSGDLDMDGNDIIDAALSGDWKGTGGQLIGTAIRGAEDDSSNEIVVPDDGSRATAGGVPLLTEEDSEGVSIAAFKVGMIMDWFGAAIDCPDGWAICDGTNGTPDMRGLFSIGAGGDYALDDEGGSDTASGNTGSGGGHTPSGTVGGHALTAAEGPAHRHFAAADAEYSGGGEQALSASNQMYRSTNGGPGGDTQYILRGVATEATVGRTSSSGSGDAHTHPLTMDAVDGHTHALGSIETLPPYRALYKIMFIGF